MEWLFKSNDPLWETLAGCLAVFFLIILCTRIIGLRSFAKFTAYDFAITIAVGSIISSILTSSTTVVQGFVAIFGLLTLTFIFSVLQKRSSALSKLISNQPVLLMDGPKILYNNLKTSRVQEEQLFAKLREANVLNLEQVCAVVLESTGDISVIHRSSADSSENFEEQILLGVSEKGRERK
ncbi:DUF421 domain-containing protein [Salinimicrobium soli]|uniref:DUF421 domain-containing protein n=1 Tax=Salinimicrobium soli TaxID=1254399 RepID=UPI003AAEFC00